ncbi:MAG TPA: hypothetical protein VH683_12560 [Thermoleophilaceae bacterium]
MITWIAVGGLVGFAICARNAQGTTWIAKVAIGAVGGFVGGGLAALFWNRASTNVELLGVVLAAVTAATLTVAAGKAHVGEPDRG